MSSLIRLADWIVGDTAVFTYTGEDANRDPEDITGHTIVCTISDLNGNSIARSIGSGITVLAQSGETLGQAAIRVEETDYPAPWLALNRLASVDTYLEVERTGGTFTSTVQARWKLTGQLVP